MPQALGRPAAPAISLLGPGSQAGLHTVSRGSAGLSTDPIPLRRDSRGRGSRTAAGWFRHARSLTLVRLGSTNFNQTGFNTPRSSTLVRLGSTGFGGTGHPSR